MFCPKCGSNLPDNVKFCSVCGEKLNVEAPVSSEPEIPAVSVEVPVEAPVSGIKGPGVRPDAPAAAAPVITGLKIPKLSPRKSAEEAAPEPETPAPEAPAKPIYVKPKKKLNPKLLAAAGGALVVLVLVIVGIVALISGAGPDNAYAYISGGKYELVTNIKSDKIIEIASTKSDSDSGYLYFSPDGKYLYYFTKVDVYNGIGTLCRAQYGKLKADSSKNEKYIETIDKNVSIGLRMLEDGTVFYLSGDNNTLYGYDGKESVKIAKEVESYYVNDSHQILYQTGNYSDGYTLYGTTLKDPSGKIKLDTNVYSVVYTGDFDNLLYTKEEDDDSLTLYTAGFNKDSEKLASDVTIKGYEGDKVFFSAENGESVSLYDFVEDDYAEADASLKEPVTDDYGIPRYDYEMITHTYPDENSFDELYTSCTNALYWYGESTWWCYSMEDALYVEWEAYSDEIHAATQSFIDRFASSADENGYIKVTSEVKAALQEINAYASNPESSWMWLCFNKYQSGTTTDWDTYYADCDKWNAAEDRIWLREELQKRENNFALSNLYCFEKGKVTTICENILNSAGHTGGMIYNTSELITNTIAIEDMDSLYDVRDLLTLDPEAENYVVMKDSGKIIRMSSSAADDFANAAEDVGASSVSFYFFEKSAYMKAGDELFVAEISKDTVGSFEDVTDGNFSIAWADDSTLYCFEEIYDHNGVNYCDLYAYKNGEATLLAEDVVTSNITLYKDGVILAYTDYRNNRGYELTMINKKGESTLVSDDVSQYIRVDGSTLMYISDGDLFCYNGKKNELVREDVDYFWSLNKMETNHIFSWYYSGYDYYG